MHFHRRSAFLFPPQEALAEWTQTALKETDAHLQRHLRLPELNGILEVTIAGAEGLSLNAKGG